MNNMPKIDFNKITSEKALEVAKAICKKDGTLYSTKPKKANGLEQYMWRIVAFTISPVAAHQCIPVMCDFDLYNWMEENLPDVVKYDRKIHKNISEINTAYKKVNDPEFKQWLKDIENQIINTVPKEMWYGTKRWAKAFGVI